MGFFIQLDLLGGGGCSDCDTLSYYLLIVVFSSVIEAEAGVLQCGKQWFLQTFDFWWEWKFKRNGREVAVVAYLDCIHDLVSIIFIAFIGNTLLPGSSAH